MSEKKKSPLVTALKWVIAFVFIIGVISYLAGQSTNAPAVQAVAANSPQTPATAPASSAPAVTVPPLEQQIVNIVATYVEKYNAAPNQMTQGMLRHQRAQDLCHALAALDASGDPQQIHDWVGTVSTLSSNNDGKGVLQIAVNGNLTFGTWNNDLSDIDGNTMIPAGSALQAKVAALSTSQEVYFSGYLFPDSDDCMKEMSMTMDGAMQNPEFLMRFTAVTPVASH